MVTKKLKHIKHYSQEQKETQFHLHLQRKDSSPVLPSASSTMIVSALPSTPTTLHKALHRTKQRRDRRALRTRPGARAADPQRAIQRGARSPCQWRRCAPGGKRRDRRSCPQQGVADFAVFCRTPPPQLCFPRPVICVGGAEEKSQGRGRDEQKGTPT